MSLKRKQKVEEEYRIVVKSLANREEFRERLMERAIELIGAAFLITAFMVAAIVMSMMASSTDWPITKVIAAMFQSLSMFMWCFGVLWISTEVSRTGQTVWRVQHFDKYKSDVIKRLGKLPDQEIEFHDSATEISQKH